MDQRGADQPGQEGRVFHRIPEPPAAPAEHVIGPLRTHGDADGQADPGGRGPGPRPARPGRVESAVEQRRDGKGKRHRHAHIAHVEHRRVEHQARVLQHRVQVLAVGRNLGQARKRVRCDQHEQQETHGHQTEHAEHTRHHHVGQLAREDRHGHHPGAQHQQPQQQRALVTAPDRGDAVNGRQQRIGMLGHVQHRKVIAVEGPGQAAKGKHRQGPEHLRAGARQRHPVGAPLLPADHAQRAQRERHEQREDQRKMPNFRNHEVPLESSLRVARAPWPSTNTKCLLAWIAALRLNRCLSESTCPTRFHHFNDLIVFSICALSSACCASGGM